MDRNTKLATEQFVWLELRSKRVERNTWRVLSYALNTREPEKHNEQTSRDYDCQLSSRPIAGANVYVIKRVQKVEMWGVTIMSTNRSPIIGKSP